MKELSREDRHELSIEFGTTILRLAGIIHQLTNGRVPLNDASAAIRGAALAQLYGKEKYEKHVADMERLRAESAASEAKAEAEAVTDDPVRPDYYQGGIEAIEVMDDVGTELQAYGVSAPAIFDAMTALKYALRAGRKTDDATLDLKKCAAYMYRAIQGEFPGKEA